MIGNDAHGACSGHEPWRKGGRGYWASHAQLGAWRVPPLRGLCPLHVASSVAKPGSLMGTMPSFHLPPQGLGGSCWVNSSPLPCPFAGAFPWLILSSIRLYCKHPLSKRPSHLQGHTSALPSPSLPRTHCSLTLAGVCVQGLLFTCPK